MRLQPRRGALWRFPYCRFTALRRNDLFELEHDRAPMIRLASHATRRSAAIGLALSLLGAALS